MPALRAGLFLGPPGGPHSGGRILCQVGTRTRIIMRREGLKAGPRSGFVLRAGTRPESHQAATRCVLDLGRFPAQKQWPHNLTLAGEARVSSSAPCGSSWCLPGQCGSGRDGGFSDVILHFNLVLPARTTKIMLWAPILRLESLSDRDSTFAAFSSTAFLPYCSTSAPKI